MFLYIETVEEFEALAREFGRKLKQFYIILNVPTLEEARRVLALVND